MGRQKDRGMKEKADRRMGGQKDGRTEGWVDRRMGGQKDGRIGKWVDRRMGVIDRRGAREQGGHGAWRRSRNIGDVRAEKVRNQQKLAN